MAGISDYIPESFSNDVTSTNGDATQPIIGGDVPLTDAEIIQLAKQTKDLQVEFKDQKNFIVAAFVVVCVSTGVAIAGMAVAVFMMLGDYWNNKNMSYVALLESINELETTVSLQCPLYEKR